MYLIHAVQNAERPRSRADSWDIAVAWDTAYATADTLPPLLPMHGTFTHEIHYLRAVRMLREAAAQIEAITGLHCNLSHCTIANRVTVYLLED